MDRSKLWEFVPIIGMFTWMMITPWLYPRDWVMRYIMNMVGMVFCIGLMVLSNEILKYKSAEFTHIDAICRPSGNRLHIYAKDLRTAEYEPGIYATMLTLGERLVHSIYGEIEKGGNIVIKHWGKWEDRMGEYKQGKAVFKDQVVDHPKSAQVILYEPPDVFDLDHLSPIPVFELKDAPMDYQMPEDQKFLDTSLTGAGDLLVKTVLMEGKQVSGATLLFSYQRVKVENQNLKTRIIEKERQALHWHQKAVNLEEVNKQIKNELHAVLSSKSDQKQSVIEQVLTALEAHTKIRNALKELKPVAWLNKMAVMLILGIVGFGVFLMNPGGIMQWMGEKQNQFFIIILAMIISFAYFYTRQKK